MLVSYQNFFEFPELISFRVLNFPKNFKIRAIPESNLWIIIKDLKSSIVRHLVLSKGHIFLISVLKGFNLKTVFSSCFKISDQMVCLYRDNYFAPWVTICWPPNKIPFQAAKEREPTRDKFWKNLIFCSC